jgi:Zn-dependent protease
MALQDRDYNRAGGGGGGGDFGEGGGFRRAMRRIFVEGDDFYGWSFPLFTVPHWVPGLRGIQVRIHLLFVVFIIAELIWSLKRDAEGPAIKAFEMGWLWLLVILHEFGHCLACRLVGGEADRVLLWPLGGLAMCRPPQNWRASLITTLGGPGVNFALIPVLGAALLAAGAGWHAVIFNPFDPMSVWKTVDWFSINTSYWRYLLWTAHYINFLLFAFNMCLVMYPMDAGRVFQELLWWRMGYKRSLTIATNVGLVVAVCIGTFAVLSGQGLLLGIALFGGITCFNQRRMLAVMEDEPAWAYETDRGYRGFKDSGPSPQQAAADKAYQAALKRQQKERELQSEVDRILGKIREKGMQSLSRKEQAILKDATERTRGKE